MLTSLTAQQTLDRAKSALQTGRGAGLPELLKLIETLSTDIHKVTIGELVELIEKDAAVMTRVISVANTLAHNPGITPLSSLTHAIHQIGFQRIRSLAVSLMLIENTGRDGNPAEQREAASQALCAGLIAQGCARSLGSVEPELAFACATLRHFGQIMLPVVSLEHYREAKVICATQTEDAAFRDRFGLTPLELTRQLLAPARLPDEVMRSLRDCQPESMAGVATMFEARLLGLADFGSRLARHALDGALRVEAFDEKARQLARHFEKILPGAIDLIEPALLHTDLRLSSFSRCNGVSSLPTASLQRIHARVVQRTPMPSSGLEISDHSELARDASPGVVGIVANPADSRPPDAIDAEPGTAAAEGSEILATRNDVPASRSSIPLPAPEVCWTEEPPETGADAEAASSSENWTAALERVRAEFAADDCWVFLTQPGGLSLPLVCGIGENWQTFQAHAALRADERTVFGVCLSLRGNVVIHDTSESSLASYLPGWFRGGIRAPGAFVLVPLHDGVKANGLVLIGWQRPQRLNLTTAQTELARQVFAAANARQQAA